MGHLCFKAVCVVCYTFLVHTKKIKVADTWAVPLLLILL